MALPTISCDELRRKIEGGKQFVLVDLLALGYTIVRHYAGGKDEWRKAGLPLERAGKPLEPD